MKSNDGRFEIEHERTDSHDHFLRVDYEWRLIDRRTGQRIVLFAETVSSGPTDVRFLGDGREIVVTNYDGTVVERHTLPVLIKDCLLWLRSDLGLSIDDDATNMQWEDRSGNGAIAKSDRTNHSARPTYNASPINEQPTLRFDATKSQSLGFDPAHPIPSSAEVHAFVVHRNLRAKKRRCAATEASGRSSGAPPACHSPAKSRTTATAPPRTTAARPFSG